jgi:hypothetical protein
MWRDPEYVSLSPLHDGGVRHGRLKPRPTAKTKARQ